MSGSKFVPTLEWVIKDNDTLRSGLAAMLRFRKMNLEKLAWAMARDGVARNVLAAFLRGKQANLRSDTLIDIIEALDLELVVRRKPDKKIKARTAALVAERGQGGGEEDVQAAVMALVPEDARDANGHLKRPLTEQERAEAHALLDRYGSFS
jgi:DNA-binding Xre family transcriptional regulator